MKNLLLFLMVILTALLSGCVQPQTQETTTQWLGGHVPIALAGQYTGRVGWLQGMELGLRSDGVLVYRKEEERVE